MPGVGRVVLVGGGPGDPGLITVAGRQWLARADVLVTDRLGPTSLLSELGADVSIIDVGKTAGNHPIPQHEINRILVEHARAGRTVIRLKGGDPFVLGRGGEEALYCLAHAVPVEVVPGVTSAVSVPAAAGIPVTHRGITTSLVIASAHAGAGQALDAARSAPHDATLVLLMGLSGLAGTMQELIAAGRDPRTPVAVISDGWTPRQRTVTGTLASIAADVAAAALPGPAVIVVGDVVDLRAELGDLAGVPRVEIGKAG
jgi:uroporphyrin-III C-methyltransferase/precorrin-2 dehydrogenase/sirohydrochlorin ferrochelatase